jgi:hypothetical protein
VVACLLGRDHESIHDMLLVFVWSAYFRSKVVLLMGDFGYLVKLQKRRVSAIFNCADLGLRTHDVINVHSSKVCAIIVRTRSLHATSK